MRLKLLALKQLRNGLIIPVQALPCCKRLPGGWVDAVAISIGESEKRLASPH